MFESAPLGMALLDNTFHIGNTDGVVAPRRITATGGPWLTLTAIWPASRHAQAI